MNECSNLAGAPVEFEMFDAFPHSIFSGTGPPELPSNEHASNKHGLNFLFKDAHEAST